ncbi:unnamed protein product [Brassica rapa subsp. narinosa]
MASFSSVSDLKPFKTMWKIRCIVMCTVAAIDSDMGWYYLSCKVCAKKVLHVPNDTIDDEDDENSIMFSYYCPKCKVSNPKLLPRY